MNGSIHWFEVVGTDAEALRGFYKGLFGWDFNVVPEMNYGLAAPKDSIPGGVGPSPVPGAGWTTFYVVVEKLEDSIAQAEAAGGRVLVAPMSLPDGRIAVIADPEGHPVGLSEPANRA